MLRFVCIPLLLAASASAWAHKPVIVANESPTNASNAYVLEDINVSQVGYHKATPEAPEIWFRFSGVAGQRIFIQEGVPKINRFASLRPRMALIGPGLPLVQLPFDAPEDLGALTFDTAGDTPQIFDEPFTGTTSWQFSPHEVVLPETGDYFLVGHLAPEVYGKFWIVAGVEEQFGLEDIVTLPGVVVEVRKFHEVFPIGGLLNWVLLLFAALVGAFTWLFG